MNPEVGWNSWQGISGGTTLGLGAILFFIFLGIAINRYRKAYKIGFAIPWHLALISISIMLLIYSSAALSALHTAWITIFLVIAAVLLLFFVYTLFAPAQDHIPDWMEPVWTPRKGYGGTIFGDFANAVGVIVGVGAYAATPLVTWWWLGHAGAILATLVGVSLAIRWMRATAAHRDDDDRARKWFAFYNVTVGVGTLVSIMAPSFKNGVLELGIVNSLAVLIVWGILLGAFLLLSIILFIIHHNNRQNAYDYNPVLWILLIVLFLCGGAFLGMFKPIADKTWSQENLAKIGGFVFGLLAGCAWVAAEIHNIVNVIRSTSNWYEKGFKITKSVFEVIGGLLLIIFVILKFAEVKLDNLWAMVVVGAILAGIGTLMGMIIGIMALRKKQKQRTRRDIQLQRMRPPIDLDDLSEHSVEEGVVVIVGGNDGNIANDQAVNPPPVANNPLPVPPRNPVLRRAASEDNVLRRSNPPVRVQRTSSGTDLGGRGNGD